jgi:stage II sporulation protein R
MLVLNMKLQPVLTFAAGEDVKIPDKAIRLRILANSNSNRDQVTKRKVRDAVNSEVATWVRDLDSIKQARRAIRSHLPAIRATVAETLKSRNDHHSFHVKFGDVQFPTKIYGKYVYPAGVYEALLITIGSGKGANWWCVLFPPLCFLDFENGDAVKQNSDDGSHQKQLTAGQSTTDKEVHVKFFFVEWFSSLFNAVVNFFHGLFA